MPSGATNPRNPPTRDALMENLYSALTDPRLENSWVGGEETNAIREIGVIAAQGLAGTTKEKSRTFLLCM